MTETPETRVEAPGDLRALLPSQDDADEVEQDFLLQVVAGRLPNPDRMQGPFRYYLITVIRNAAQSYLRRRFRQPVAISDLSCLSAIASLADVEYQTYWRACVLQNTWHALRDHQTRNRGNLFQTVLTASARFSNQDSGALAARIVSDTGQPLSAEAYRKQLSRARQKFAQLLIEEVARSLANCTPESLADELEELDLMKCVRTMLPTSVG